MKALLLFHLQVGARVAVRSFTPLFAGLLVVIMVDMYPAALVTSIALRVYAPRPALEDTLLIVLLALALPAWAVPQLALGLNGWMKHLPISCAGNRRGLALALLAVQIPLAVSFLLLSLIAHAHGLSIAIPAVRWAVVLAAGACAALPVRGQVIIAPLSLISVLLAFSTNRWMLIAAIAMLSAANALAGPVRNIRRRRPWHAAGSSLSFRISWRALGWRPLTLYLFSVVPLAAAALFISNNELTGPWAAGAARFGGSLSVLVIISGLARRLSVRRPPWPLARSFPWSAAHRVATDSLFLGLHALPQVVLSYWLNPAAVPGIIALLPFLSIRAAGSMRQMPGRRTGAGVFIAEGFFISGLFALLAWTSVLWLAAAPLAFWFARQADREQKVTRWLELHYATVGDSLSWSA